MDRLTASAMPDRAASYLFEAKKNPRSAEWTSIVGTVLKKQQHKFSILSKLFAYMYQTAPASLTKVMKGVQTYIENCNSLGCYMLCLKYALMQLNSEHDLYYYHRCYNDMVNKYSLFQKPLDALKKSRISLSDQQLEEIKVCMVAIALFFNRKNENLNSQCVPTLLDWIAVCPTDSKSDCSVISDFCRFIATQMSSRQRTAAVLGEVNVQDGSLLLSNLLEKVATYDPLMFPGISNFFLLLEHLSDMLIEGSIMVFGDQFNSFSASEYVQAFYVLTENAASPQTLKFIACLSSNLKNDGNFYALREIYREFIMPHVARFLKTSVVVQQEVYNLVTLYIEGFLDKIPPQKQWTEWLLENFQLIRRKDIDKWLRLASILNYNDSQKQEALIKQISSTIKGCSHIRELVSDDDYLRLKKLAWQFEPKDLREKKKYPLLKANNLIGIVNSGSNCYIITVIQALFMSKALPELFDTFNRLVNEREGYSMYSAYKYKLLHELDSIFYDLKRTGSLTVAKLDSLKLNGPVDFRYSQEQQDCHDYISQLFESIDSQIKSIIPKESAKQMQEVIRSIFELTTLSKIRCKDCGNEVENKESSYIHSIDFREPLRKEWTTAIEQYNCQKCKKKHSTINQVNTLASLPRVMLVHLKRFSYREGICKKDLGEVELPRKFNGNYYLAGFISHIGNNTLFGHYVLYFRDRTMPTRWYYFNDGVVSQFTLDEPDEPFELNFKAENTPYILIYMRQK